MQLNCYGFAIATSQVLDELNINHKIAFANTHSFVLAQADDCDYIVTATLRRTTGKLNYEHICHKECLENDIFSINMLNHAQEISFIPNLNYFIRQNEWVRFSQNPRRLGSDDRNEIKPNRNPKIIVRLFEPREGIRALYSFDNFAASTEANDLSFGYLMSKELVNTYPEIDIRNKPKTAELLVEKLGRLALTTLASNTIDNISAGLQKTETIAPMLWKADQYAKLSRYAAEKYFLFKSKNILESLLAENKLSLAQKELIMGKLSKNYKNLP